MDLQAGDTAEDVQGSCQEELTPYASQVPGLGCTAADWPCSRGGSAVARPRLRVAHLCAVPRVGSPRESPCLKRRGRPMTHVTAGLLMRREGDVQ